ncbi:MAG: RNA-guided endonuclease InsQ/TnpB family protein [Promethearchaeota archaeon]
MVTLTQKLTIRPTKEQAHVLWTLAQACRKLYNQALAERKFLYQHYNVQVSYVDQQNGLPQLKQVCPDYQQVYSKVLQMTLKKLDAAYKSYFGLVKQGEKTARPPGFRGRHYFFTLCYNQSGFKITPQSVQFSHKCPTKIPLVFKVPFDFTTYHVKQIEIFQEPYDKRFYLAVTYEVDDPEYSDNGLYQAFDLGVTKHTAVNMVGKFLESKVKRPDNYWEPTIRALQQRQDHCKKGSRRWRTFHQRLVTVQKKCRNQTKDWQHKQSLQLLKNTQANTIIVGDLSVKQMAQNKTKNKNKKQAAYPANHTNHQPGLHRAVHNTGHLGRFVELLTYKAHKLGKRVIVIDERDTTKTCWLCGQRKDMPLHQRQFLCECGNQLDRDQNAAINIMCRFLSQHALWTSYQTFLKNIQTDGNLRHFLTAKRKTKVALTTHSKGWADS